MLSQAHTGMLSVRVSASSTSSKSSKDKSPKLDLRCCYKSCAVNQPDNKDKRSICVAGGGLNVVPSNLDSGTKKDFPRPTWCCEQDCSVLDDGNCVGLYAVNEDDDDGVVFTGCDDLGGTDSGLWPWTIWTAIRTDSPRVFCCRDAVVVDDSCGGVF